MRVPGLHPLPLLCACALLLACEQKTPPVSSATSAPKAAAVAGEARTYLFRYELSNPDLHAVRDATLSVSLPLPSGLGQRVDAIHANYPYSQVRDAEGNSRLIFTFKDLAPLAHKQIEIKVELHSGLPSEPLLLSEASRQVYLRPAALVQSDDPQIQALAQQLSVAGKPKQSARNIYNWAIDNLHYTHNSPIAHGAKVALAQRSGDCTEYMHLVMALARAAGIPARAVSGYVYSQNGVVKAADYHDWAELYLEGRWLLVDAQRQLFVESSPDYLSMVHAGESDSGSRFIAHPESLRVVFN